MQASSTYFNFVTAGSQKLREDNNSDVNMTWQIFIFVDYSCSDHFPVFLLMVT